ncbi:hypothetical protein [Pseudobutyrivibrio sp.]
MNYRIICSGLGFVAGGLLGFFLGSHVCAKEYKKTIDQLEYENDILRKKVRDKKTDDSEAEESDTHVKLEAVEDEEEDDTNGVTYTNFVALSKKYGSESFNEHFESRVGPDENSIDPTDIKIITEKQYHDEFDYRDHDTLTFYQPSQVLADSQNAVVADEENVIGTDALDKLCDTKNDYMYVLNEAYDTLYEIAVEHDAVYRRDVMNAYQ